MINRNSAKRREKLEWMVIRQLARTVVTARDQVLADNRFPGQVKLPRPSREEK